MHMAVITVIVPVYKVEKYLQKCVDSILAQSFQDFDLILVDDGSPDRCGEICDAYAEKDKRITVIHKRNGGLSDARNAGIDWAMEHSGSEWLAFVDSDDYLHPDFFRIQLETAERESGDLVICDYYDISNVGEIDETQHSFFDLATEDKNRMYECLCMNWRIVTAWNKLYKKDIFAQLRFPVGKIHEDSFVIHRVLWNCHKAVFIPNRLYYYRHRNNSIMAMETPKSRLDGYEAMVQQHEFGREHHIFPLETDLPIGYLNETNKLSPSFNKQETQRFKQLRKRFAKVFFSQRNNRNLKRYLGFYFTGLYCKAAAKNKRSF